MVSNLNRFRLYLHNTTIRIEHRNMDNTRHFLIYRFGFWGPDNRQRTQLLSSQPTKKDKGFKWKFNSSKHLKTTLCWRLTGHIAGGTHTEGGGSACGSIVLSLGTCIKYCIWYLHVYCTCGTQWFHQMLCTWYLAEELCWRSTASSHHRCWNSIPALLPIHLCKYPSLIPAGIQVPGCNSFHRGLTLFSAQMWNWF